MYKNFLRPLLFSLDSELVHECFLNLARVTNKLNLDSIIAKICGYNDRRLATKVFGINFPSPVGLAAGFDKNCDAVGFFSALGFGFIEIGTVVPRPQAGNPKPRIFRLPKDRALINRMGFPSGGAEKVLENLRSLRSDKIKSVIAVNIGKNKETDLDKALEDYSHVLINYYEYASFFVVNVSSPNTPDLRKLQQKEKLLELLNALQVLNNKNKPILVKIAPDLTNAEIDDVLDCCALSKIAGIVCTNTTSSREGIVTETKEQGGLSGKPLFKKSLEIVRYVSSRTEKKLPIIAVGGISSSEDVIAMLRAGASLVEVYTSLVYEGPMLVNRIKKELIRYMDAEGLQSIGDIIAG